MALNEMNQIIHLMIVMIYGPQLPIDRVQTALFRINSPSQATTNVPYLASLRQGDGEIISNRTTIGSVDTHQSATETMKAAFCTDRHATATYLPRHHCSVILTARVAGPSLGRVPFVVFLMRGCSRPL